MNIINNRLKLNYFETNYFDQQYLVGHIGDTDVEEWQIVLENVSNSDLQLVLKMRSLHTLLKLGNESRIDFTGYHLFGLFQQPHGHVTCTRTNLEHGISWLQCRL